MMKKHIQSSPGAHWFAQPALSIWFCFAVCQSMASTSAEAAPLELSNQSLDAITAAQLEQSPTHHEPGQPTTNINIPDSDSDGDIAAGTGIVVDHSSATAEFVNEVSLTDAAQQDVRGANVVNAVVSASASGTNVFSVLVDDGVGDNDGFAVRQSNLIEQIGAQHAAVGRYSVVDGRATRTFNETRSEYSLREKHIETSVTDRTGTISVRDTEFWASVPRLTIGDLVLTVAKPPAIPDIEVPLVTIGKKVFVKVVLVAPILTLGNIVWSDEKGIELQSATLKFPSIDIYVLGEKVSNSGTKTFSIGSLTLLDIENPVDEFGRAGFAAYGNGEITTTAGSLTLTTKIDLERIIKAAVGDIGIPGTEINLSNLLDKLPKKLPVFELAVSAELDPFKGLARSFGKDEFGNDTDPETYCFPADSTTCSLIERTTDTTNGEHTSTETSSNVESQSSGYSRNETLSQRAPVEVRDAEAKIIVLDESSINDERYDLVLVAEGSQNGMRVLNGVNATSSITGNGVNIVADRATARMPSERGSNSYLQTNHITQIGGL